MTPEEIQQALRIGIEAAKRGQKQHARDLLMQVVEADERSEQGWLWLSAVIESVEDQITALENVLDINPNNQSAQKGIAYLRSKLPPPPAAPPEPEPAPEAESGGGAPAPAQPDTPLEAAAPESAFADLEPESDLVPLSAPIPATESELEEYADLSPIESVSDLDDPNQCVFCGAIVARELRRCPECGRSLVVKEGKRGLSPALRTTVFAILFAIAAAALGAMIVTMVYFGGGGGLVQYVFESLDLSFIFGNYTAWPAWLTPIVMWTQFGLLAALIVCMLGLAYQVSLAYYGSIVVLSLSVLWAAFRWVNGFTGPVLAIVDMVAAIATLFFVFAAQPDFQVNLVRLRCGVDPRIKGGEALHKLGVIHRKQGEWAWAVAHWRAAIAAMPNQPDFYKDLAIGYAQIRYYRRALRILDEYTRQSPDDSDIDALRQLIEEKQSKDPKPRH